MQKLKTTQSGHPLGLVIPTKGAGDYIASTQYLMRLPELLKITGLGRSSAYLRMNKNSPYYDPEFPRPIPLSQNRKGAVGFLSTDVHNWVNNRVSASVNNGQPYLCNGDAR